MTNDNLKPCPFCGLDDEIYLEQGYSLDPNKYPVCRNCASKGLRDYNIESWNNRPIEDAKDARIAELEQQLAEAKRGNLRQRVDDMLMCDIDNQSHSMAVNIVSRLCSSKHGTFREATAHIQNILLHNQQRDMAITSEKVYDWLIEQGVEGCK